MVLFGAEEGLPIYNRFSVMILTMYLYYGMSYYFVLDTPMEKPHIGIFMIVMALHILQVVLIKYLHENEYYPFIWLVIILPVVLFILAKKIMDNRRKKAEKRAALRAAAAQAQVDPVELGFRNAKPQRPTNHSVPINAHKPQHMNNHYDSANMNKGSLKKQNRNLGNIIQDIDMQYDPNGMGGQRTMNVVDNTPDYSSRMSINQLAPTGHTGMPNLGTIGGPAMVGGFDAYATDFSSF